MTLSALLIAISMNLSAQAFMPQTPPANFQAQACVQNCLAWNEKPGAELKACVAKCQELLTK
ncbi:MAG: hypothetical protein EOP11_14200 [Proteobacteria bacterium]|nr:MAG: hypothetical protein EOP11_14200 [Pseudomonadota bacterium]